MTKAMTRLSRLGLVLLAPAALVLVLKVYVADVYRVDSGSMEPTIHGPAEGAELVLVHYDRDPELARHDLVVLLRAGEREPIVKRVVGLPGEELQIQAGDLVVDGKKLDPRAPRPAAIPIYDSDLHPVTEHFELRGEWDAGDVGSEAVLAARCTTAQASWRFDLTDDYIDPSGERVPGRQPVGDGVLECRLRLGQSPIGARCTLALSEEGDLFELRIEPRAAGHTRLTLARLDEGGREDLLGKAAISVGEETTLRFANVDDALTVDVNGLRALEMSGVSNRPLLDSADPRLRHRRPRVSLTTAGIDLEVRELRILRDLHYGEFGDIGVQKPVRLGSGEYFCLGDNSSESVDGRTFGSVQAEEVHGFPLAVIWPFSRARWLEAVDPPRTLAPE
jgi:signal peptidase I